ncbi:hypothetical protein [Moorena sp. SIO3H5]|uniref:hypothetical protein n=1 Tax=Moorena sp. SIO3H5 TaxID=2607834 RepID=UPI0013B81726|nr:hypothetical protein [Moorena sp. SIO3H5]NEO68005.1 hypothetical protein [Moorena sp. SIO3H5]
MIARHHGKRTITVLGRQRRPAGVSPMSDCMADSEVRKNSGQNQYISPIDSEILACF